VDPIRFDVFDILENIEKINLSTNRPRRETKPYCPFSEGSFADIGGVSMWKQKRGGVFVVSIS
jgi:hypothetical protein